MLNNWEVNLTLREDYLEVLEKLCAELIQEFDKPEEERDHFLLDAKDQTEYCVSHLYRGKTKKEKAKMQNDAFIDLIYSYDFEAFVSFFFKDLVFRKETNNNAYKWFGWLDAYERSEYEYCAGDELRTFLELICTTDETYIEKQVFEEEGLPVRLVMTPSTFPGNRRWREVYPRLVWPDNDC